MSFLLLLPFFLPKIWWAIIAYFLMQTQLKKLAKNRTLQFWFLPSSKPNLIEKFLNQRCAYCKILRKERFTFFHMEMKSDDFRIFYSTEWKHPWWTKNSTNHFIIFQRWNEMKKKLEFRSSIDKILVLFLPPLSWLKVQKWLKNHLRVNENSNLKFQRKRPVNPVEETRQWTNPNLIVSYII